MLQPGYLVSRKLYRVAEALHLILSYAADQSTRLALMRIYASLGRRERYDEEVDLRLLVRGRVFPFRIRLSDIFVLGEIFHDGQYRLQSTLPPAPVIVDAGGNIGASAVWFLGCHPEATLLVFEPAEGNFRLLSENLAHLKRVKLFRSALGRRTEVASLYHGEFAGMHSLVDHASGAGESVSVMALEEFMTTGGIDRIDLLKLDVEGSELDVLKGMGERIRDLGVLIGEVHEKFVDPGEFYDFLAHHGFRICWKRNFRESKQEEVHGFEAARLPRGY